MRNSVNCFHVSPYCILWTSAQTIDCKEEDFIVFFLGERKHKKSKFLGIIFEFFSDFLKKSITLLLQKFQRGAINTKMKYIKFQDTL